MNFDAFWEVVKWLVPLGVGGLFWLMWRLNDSLKKDIDGRIEEQNKDFEERTKEHVARSEDHQRRDDVSHTGMTREFEALRQQLMAFQLEVAKNYVTTNSVNIIEGRLREDLDEIKGDVKTLLKHALEERVPRRLT